MSAEQLFAFAESCVRRELANRDLPFEPGVVQNTLVRYLRYALHGKDPIRSWAGLVRKIAGWVCRHHHQKLAREQKRREPADLAAMAAPEPEPPPAIWSKEEIDDLLGWLNLRGARRRLLEAVLQGRSGLEELSAASGVRKRHVRQELKEILRRAMENLPESWRRG